MAELTDFVTIGVTFSSTTPLDKRPAYLEAIAAQGARAVEIVAGEEEWRIEDLEGILLAGGGDIDPARFKQTQHAKTIHVDLARDELELRLAREAVAAHKPVLGICRGAQVLGVAFGGDLIQDIPDLVPNARQHDNGEHPVWVAPDSRLGQILGDRAEVNSFHHQANASLGAGLRVAAWSDDNVIEAVEALETGFVLGVQWHPERMEPVQGALFAAFVAAAVERKRS